MFNPSRDQARLFFVETWRKFQQQQPLTDLEKMTLAIIQRHPEYHPFLQNKDALDRDWRPEFGETNPFLHLSMHLAIDEQLSIDQPQGVRGIYQQLLEKFQDAHHAQHEIMDGLAEMIWQAQRTNTAPNPDVYFAALQRKLGMEK